MNGLLDDVKKSYQDIYQKLSAKIYIFLTFLCSLVVMKKVTKCNIGSSVEKLIGAL